ncbi:hypothetical protein CFIO01_05395 [Colletotrichum fioriniae PJ7]|uniref:Uncharacterized protein n=1 Tax=Colletotrichum fioriniae PJ7 TaxID=1445577 RepID=A0A010RVM8_9PEZI|nr:hypothetical protein CFIO01_05395 [Colletotrichum fioriniae PJ7]
MQRFKKKGSTKLPAQALLPSFIPSSRYARHKATSVGGKQIHSIKQYQASKASTCDIRQPQTVPVSRPSASPSPSPAPHQSSSPNHPAMKNPPPPGPSAPRQRPQQSNERLATIPKVVFALPHLITPVAVAALAGASPHGYHDSEAAAVLERHAPNQR